MRALRLEGWTLREAESTDIDAVMRWFTTREDVEIWGGPDFRYPFTRTTFRDDIMWAKIASFGLLDPEGDLAAFGQVYDRERRIHLARLVVAPDRRGHGIGRRLIILLMRAGRELYSRNEVSLFVFRDNIPAYQCYLSLGFEVRDYPDDMPHADVCYYLTKDLETKEA